MPSTPSAKPGASQTSTGGTTEYRFMGTHATEVQLGDALPWLEPGEIVELSDTDVSSERISHLINAGILVETSTIGVEPDPQAQTQGQSQSQDDEDAKGGK